MKTICSASLAGIGILLAAPQVHALNFETEGGIRGSFDSTISVGTGIRTKSPACDLVVPGSTGDGAPSGCLAPTAGIYDQGDLNYGKGDAFTRYIKGTHELLLKMPSDVTFMARGTWMKDFAATNTTGILSSLSPAGLDGGLPADAREDLRFKARLLDFWVSKSFDVMDKQVRVRAGNQVINWGESMFIAGGINNTNAYDVQRLSLPGTQLKEAVLPAPMISAAAGLGNGFNVEAYSQFRWNKNYLPPVGSYWSYTNSLGQGNSQFGVSEKEARDQGQWGLSLRYQPPRAPINLGLYVMNYHDKTPQLGLDQTTFAQQWVYLEDRKLIGASVNFPLGDWAIGSEVSYRPKDAVSLNPSLGCTTRDGRCWIEAKRWQWNINGIYSLTPSNSRPFLDLTGADTGTFLFEFAATRFPGLQDQYGGDLLAAGNSGWGQERDPTAAPALGGTRTSTGIALDFSLTYDGSLIDGWQVTPEIYYYQALSGRTPNIASQFLTGAKSMNLQVAFASIPAKWQVVVNYARFMGSGSPLTNPLKDRDYVGVSASRTF